MERARIKRKAIAGLPEWYKEKLIEKQFEKVEDEQEIQR